MSSPSPTPFVDENPFSPLDDSLRNVTIVFLVCVALLFSWLILAYMTTMLADRWCGCCFRFPAETGSMDHGSVSMWGLSQAEWARILPLLFQKTSFLWTMEQEGTNTTDTTTSNDDPTKLQTPAATLQVESPTRTKVVSLEEDDDDDDVRACCSICLTAFEPGVCVMTGTTCAHVFHSSCCMEWLRQHDQCPYCRQEFMTAQELRQAAIAVLGSQRVHQLDLPGLQGIQLTTQSLELPTMRPGQETSTNEEEPGGLQEPNEVDLEAGAVGTEETV
jgi:hypothetical protein